MNCQELRNDVSDLESLEAQLEAALDEAIENGKDRFSVENLCNELNRKIEGTIEKHYEGARESLPGVKRYTFGEKIDGVGKKVNVITRGWTSTEWFIGGSDGIQVFVQDENGNLKHDGSLAGVKEEVLSITPVSGGKSVWWIGGKNGIKILPQAYPNRNNVAFDTTGFCGEARTIVQISNEELLVGGESGLYRLRIDYGHITGLEELEKVFTLPVSSVQIFGDDLLVGCSYGGVFWLRKRGNNYDIDSIPESRDYKVNDVCLMGGARIMIGANGVKGLKTMGLSGKNFGEIGGFETNVESIVQMEKGRWLVGGGDNHVGELRVLRYEDMSTIESFKRVLNHLVDSDNSMQ